MYHSAISFQKNVIFIIAIVTLWIPHPSVYSLFPDNQLSNLSAQEPTGSDDFLLRAQKVTELGSAAMSSFREGKYAVAFKNCSELCELEPNNLNYQMILGDISCLLYTSPSPRD